MSVSLNGVNNTVNNHESRIKALEGKIGAGGGIVESSLNNPGYIKFANGLLMQFGTGSGWVTFPKAFPNKCIAVATSSQHNAGWNEDTVVNSISATGFCSHLARYGTGYTVACNYIAIGY